MFVIRLSAIARWNLMEILNKQAKGKMGDKKYKTACALYEKICISDEEVEHKFFDKEGKAVAQAFKDADDLDVVLNYNEMERLEDILGETELRPVDRKVWAQYLFDQLAKAKEPSLDDEKTKSERLDARRKNAHPELPASERQ